jgi:feruloyl esterase
MNSNGISRRIFFGGLQPAAAMTLVLSSVVAVGQTAPAVSCDSLAKLALPQATVTMAETVAAGEFKMPVEPGAPAPPAAAAPSGPTPPPGLAPAISPNQGANPEFCRFAATLKASSDSEVKIEVWMPLKGWNGKFLGVANTGWAGSVMYSGLLDGIQHGFAAGSTDSGHESVRGVPNGSFITGHPEKLVDYGHRAIHEMTIASKAVVKAYYGAAPKFSLFTGCSLGGMQALQEAYRFPEDYEGIVAGAPANPMTMFNAAQMWPAMVIFHDPAKAIPASKFTIIHEAALKACAGPIGLKQGYIEHPDRCDFDPKALLCKGADGPDCLTAPQVELMRAIYEGPVNPKTKEVIFPGPPRGAELQLGMYTGSTPMMNAYNLYKFAVYQDPNWDWKTMDYDSSIETARKVVDPQMRAGNDLTPFIKHGGKLMIYIGWTDYHNPMELVGYYNSILKNANDPKASDALRLFTIPGMDHCFGGFGCDTFDELGIIDKWVESGTAPEQFIAKKVAEGKTVRTSVVCAYPKVARYKDSGDTEDAANFECAAE